MLRRLACLVPLLLAACSGSGSSRSAVLFVSPAGGGRGDGSAWEHAYSDLQAAIDAARPGAEIWVAAGTYRPAPPGGSREASFRLRTGIVVRGGFEGHESAAEQRAGTAETVLSGDLDGDDGARFTQRADNVYHVVKAFDLGGSGTLERVTIRGGQADGPGKGPSPDSRDQGSGIDIFNASPRLVDCLFEDNWSSNHGTANDHGLDSVFEGCTFRGNGAGQLGAGLYVHHHSRTLAVECLFEGNQTPGQGAGAYFRSHEGARLEDCEFRDNVAVFGGGVYIAAEAHPHISGCHFERNQGSIGGGGIYCDNSAPEIVDCTFVENEAGVGIADGGGGGGGSGGGGIWSDGGAPLIEGCRFVRNQASLGAGVYLILFSNAVVRACEFEENVASEAGGLYTLNSDALVEDCLFVRNEARGGSFAVGGGASNYFSNATFSRCTFLGNGAELGGGGVYVEGESPALLECTYIGNTSHGAAEGWGGGLFVSYFCRVLVRNNLFLGNRANLGGGIYHLAFAESDVVNATLIDNVALAGGGGIHVNELATPRLANSILAGNLPAEIGGAAHPVRYSLVRGGYPGEFVRAGAPAFVLAPAPGPDGLYGTLDDPAYDLRPAPGSECIDAGDNTALDAGSELDLAGRARFRDDPEVLDQGFPVAPLVDLGAFERHPAGP